MCGRAGIAALLLLAAGGAALKPGPPNWLPPDAFPPDGAANGDGRRAAKPGARAARGPPALDDEYSPRITASIGHLSEVSSHLHGLQVELVKQRQLLADAEEQKAIAQAEFDLAAKEAADQSRTKGRLVVKLDDIFRRLNLHSNVAGTPDSKAILQLLYEKRVLQNKLNVSHFDDSTLAPVEAENAQLKATIAEQRQATARAEQAVKDSQQHEADLAAAHVSSVSVDELNKQHEQLAATQEKLLAEQKRLDDALKFTADPIGMDGQPPVPSAAAPGLPGALTMDLDPAADDPACSKELASVRTQIREGMQTTADLNTALGQLAPPAPLP